MPPAPTLAQIQSLHTATVSAASRFASYNFKTHFLRRTEENFRPVLTSLSSSAGATSSSSHSPIDVAKFYEEQSHELGVLKRASEVNRLFEGPKLVVEHARPIMSGGGAGMEASAGGGGQPV